MWGDLFSIPIGGDSRECSFLPNGWLGSFSSTLCIQSEWWTMLASNIDRTPCGSCVILPCSSKMRSNVRSRASTFAGWLWSCQCGEGVLNSTESGFFWVKSWPRYRYLHEANWKKIASTFLIDHSPWAAIEVRRGGHVVADEAWVQLPFWRPWRLKC